MKRLFASPSLLKILSLSLLLMLSASVRVLALSPNPDLTAAGAIATLKADANASPVYGQTYNLGPTGLRGWIYIDRNNVGSDGFQTAQSRQILVTVVGSGTPAAGVLAVDDVILGVDWGSGTGAIPSFTSDARKAFGNAITEAEKTENSGILRLKRWRAGVTTDVSITLSVMGSYTASAPYSCPKSALILANARTKLVGQLLANPNFLINDWDGAVNGLALLAGVMPGDPDYATVQTRLQTYARACAATGPQKQGLDIWTWGYMGIFLSEYYLSTGDANVLPGINQFTVKLAQSQSMYGTFGHNPAMLRPDGSGRRSVIGYGPVNMAGVPANLAILLGKKALVAGAQAIDPEIDPAIQRGSDFFAYYVNKGSIPYGEHSPGAGNHASNGKDPMCAVFFSLQDNRTVETEYFTRMSIAGFTGREYGHTGQGFSYMWEGMGANVGGGAAAAEYLKNIRWHLDLERRTDGSFVYDGAEQYGAGTTSDGTYLGTSSYYDLNPTASYILTYALPLKRLYITGKAATATPLDSTKIAAAVAAATFKQDCTAYTSTQLFPYLSDFDPVVRNYAAIELAKRSLTTTEINTLLAMVTGSDANGRMGSIQTLGILQNASALPLITGRLSDPDLWVRAKAATALRTYTSATASAQLTPMLTAFTANATNPDVIDWSDPVQISNGVLSLALFGNAVPDGSPGNNVAAYTINASKSLLYPAVKAGLKQPDSYPRTGASRFCYDRLLLADVQAMINDLFNVIKYECQADRMWSSSPRASGISTLAKHKIKEGIPLALGMLQKIEESENLGFWLDEEYRNAALNALAVYGDAARWTLPTLRGYLNTWNPAAIEYTTLVNTIASIEAAITAPTLVPGMAVANSQVVVTTGSKAITLTGTSPRTSVTFTNVTTPAHGTLTGTAPNLIYTPAGGYTGPDSFTFQTVDDQTTSDPGTVSIIVGTAGTGLKGEYFDNPDFSNLKLTRTDAQVNFDWATGSPDPSVGADTFSVRWSGLLLVPETGSYLFSTLSSDGVRLYVNGVPVIDGFVDQSTKWKDGTPVQLTAGQMVELQMEYYENTGSAVAKLKWTGPSFAGANGTIIAKEWLYDGTGFPRTPYAHAQSLSTVKNTAQAITLTGSGGTLAYSILTQPAHGVLTGAPPYVTYTPDSNYSGPDSFTFLVNNGTSNSSPATVSISIWAGLPATYTWASAVSGNMSLGANWISSTAPAATGQPFYNLNFAPTGTYTVTHDLNNGFQLNQLNVAGVVTFAGSNNLTFAANGTIPPQFNQNSGNTVTVDTPLNLSAMTSFGGNGSGRVIVNSPLTGSGGLVKDNPGTLDIRSVSNSFSGGTVINNGVLMLNVLANAGLGTGPITLNGGTLYLERIIGANPIIVNGGKIIAENGFSDTWNGPITLNGILNIENPTYANFTLNGSISGSGGMTLNGPGQVKLQVANTYSGATQVKGGTLTCSNSSALGTGNLDITTGAKVALNYTGSRTIAALTFNAGAPLPPGVYGFASSPAYFSGTGTVTVLPATTTALSLTSGSTPTNAGSPLTFTATVTGSSPTGNVVFYAGTTLLGTSALNGSYQASLTTSNLAVGTYNITARYVGNASNASSVSAPVVVEITSTLPAPPTNLIAAPGNNHVGLTWTVSPGATSYYVKRSLTSGGPYTVIGNPSTGSFDDLTATNGTTYHYVVSAINAMGESANSSQVSAVAAVQSSSTTLTSSPAGSGVYGTAVTFTATVTVSGPAATGSVTFMDGGTVLGTGTLSLSTATLTTSTLAVANHSITASYAGDSTYAGSVSAPYAYAVTPKPLTVAGVTAANKVYDGTTTATLSGGTVSGGLLGGETVTLVPGSGTFANSNAGTWAVTATGYSLGGSYAGNYALSAQPTVPNATITARPIQLTGTRTYDGATTAQAGILTISNNIDGGNLSLTGSASLAGKDAGSREIQSMLARVQTATGNTGINAATSFAVPMNVTPVSGSTLIALVSTRGNTTNRVSSITQAGVTWTKAIEAIFSSTLSTTTEVWYGSGITAGAGSQATINLAASLRATAIIAEYSGLMATGLLDQTNKATGYSITPSTGITSTTTQAVELWVGGIGINNSSYTFISNDSGFTNVTSAASTNSSATANAKVFLLEKIVNTTGTAGTVATISGASYCSGVIATFKAAGLTNLALSGSAAANYTLAGLSGSVTITPKNLATTGLTASDRPYDGSATVALTGTAALPAAEAPGTGTTSDGKPYTGDTLTLGGTATGTFATKHAGNNKPVTVTGITLGGAQAGNYNLVQPTGLTANVTQLPLTVTAVNATKTYDGTTSAAGTPTLDPALVSSDTTTVLSQAFESATAGTDKVIIPSITINDGNSGANYAVTLVNSTAGTITTAVESIADWKSGNFTASEISAGLAAEDADADGDGLTNQKEYVLGTDPRSSTQQPLAIASPAGAQFTLSFTARRATGGGYTGLTRKYTVECTADPANSSSWQPVTGYTNLVGGTQAGNITGDDQTVIVTMPATHPIQFYRLNVRIE